MTSRSFRIFCPYCNRAAFTLSPDPDVPPLDDPIMTTDGRHWTRGVGDPPDKAQSRQAPISELNAMTWWVASTPGVHRNAIECGETGKVFQIHVEAVRRAWRAFRAGGKVKTLVGKPQTEERTWKPSRDW